MNIKVPLLLSVLICQIYLLSAQEKPKFSSQVMLMTKERNPEKNVLALRSIISSMKLDTVHNMEQIDILHGEVALSFLRSSNLIKFEYYIGRIKNKFNQTSYLNMAAESLFKKGVQLSYANFLAERTVKLYDAYKDNILARPTDFPAEDWDRFMRMAAYPYYETYAITLHASGKTEQALFYEEKALKNVKPEDISQSSWELRMELLSKLGEQDKLFNMLLARARLGKLTAKMKTLLEDLTVRKIGNPSDASHFLDSIERDGRSNTEKELLKKMMTNTPAPDFTMLNLKGNKVALKDLRGKIVLLDFWATWCAPCIASMPAMEKASRAHPEVVFLFVATMEPGEDSAVRINSYVKKNGFPMNVLIDSPVKNTQEFQIAKAYNVTGIPSKVLIDKKGQLKFFTAGFKSESELTSELDAMIAIVETQR
ncbi:TlpA family protein disulfide reductase [Pedobacter lithocola]